MQRKIVGTFIGILMMAFLGANVFAANDLMVRSSRTLEPKPGHALIVFMRDASFGFAFSSSIFDVTGEKTKFIGVFKDKVKCCYDVKPGEQVFMVVSDLADFMKARVEAGKTYYVRIVPRMGLGKVRFSFRPIRRSERSGEEFAEWDLNTELKEKTAAGEQWAEQNAQDIEWKRDRYWQSWCRLAPETQQSMTLNPEDGRSGK